MKTRLLAVTALAAVLVGMAPSGSERGYRVLPGVESLRGPYTLRFASEATEAVVAPYLRRPAQQLRQRGVDIRLGGTSAPVCTDGVIWVARKYRPLGDLRSRGYPCVKDGVVVGGVILINSETRPYGGTTDYPETTARNVAAHELGHALGLNHAPAPALMNPHQGGYQDHRAGLFTPADLAGIDHLRED